MWSIFKKKTKPTPPKKPRTQLRWATLNKENAGEFPDQIRKVSEDQLDGFIYRSFFSEEQCKSMLAGIETTTTSALTETPFGRVIGKRLDAEDGNFQKLELDKYFQYTSQFRAELPEILGLDFEKELHNGVQPLCDGVPLAVPVDAESRTWNPATIRVCMPGKGGIQTHVGNEFNDKMPDIRHLSKIARVHDQLSFFFLLQKPDSGGALILFDALWEDTKDALAKDYSTAVRLVESCNAFPIDMQAGDLVVFAGGRVWHRVEDVAGETDRVTLGGFMAYSNEKDKIYHWS